MPPHGGEIATVVQDPPRVLAPLRRCASTGLAKPPDTEVESQQVVYEGVS